MLWGKLEILLFYEPLDNRSTVSLRSHEGRSYRLPKTLGCLGAFGGAQL